jgi:hypothetical protein
MLLLQEALITGWFERFGFSGGLALVLVFVMIKDKNDWQKKVIKTLQMNSVTDTTTQRLLITSGFQKSNVTTSEECTDYLVKLEKVESILKSQEDELRTLNGAK